MSVVARHALGRACVGLAGLLAVSELLHWQGSHRYRVAREVTTGPCAILVLGHPTRWDGHPSALQRWRVQLAKRAFDELAATRVVFTGGPSRGRPAEADAMAELARRYALPPSAVVLERRSRTTWENVRFGLPYIAEFERVAIVSDPLHAARGRRYLRAQAPVLAERLVGAGEYQFLEHCFLKIPGLAHELYVALRPHAAKLAASSRPA
ncbi:MAG TPA: YdcF family protein [Acidimicrobiales bacterium]|nr:YdcF family protein [Acidimicrobiales bacterium]